jgi:hypothetical protein
VIKYFVSQIRDVRTFPKGRKQKGEMDMLKKLAKLIDVKSLVTLALTTVFAILSLKEVVKADQFMTVFTVVISFYFGTQVGKKEAKELKDENNQNEED